MQNMSSDFRPVLSPCTGVCRLGENGLCLGCHRSGDEIAAWRTLGDAERLRFIEDVLPLRAAEADRRT